MNQEPSENGLDRAGWLQARFQFSRVNQISNSTGQAATHTTGRNKWRDSGGAEQNEYAQVQHPNDLLRTMNRDCQELLRALSGSQRSRNAYLPAGFGPCREAASLSTGGHRRCMKTFSPIGKFHVFRHTLHAFALPTNKSLFPLLQRHPL